MNNDNNPNYEKTQRTVCSNRHPVRSARFAEPLTTQKQCFVSSVDNPSTKPCARIVAQKWILMPTTAKFAIVTLRKMFAPSAELICRATRLIALSAVARKEA